MSTYILEGHIPVVEEDVLKWAHWFKRADRHVGLREKQGVKVSTVFLGVDHSFGGSEPLLFETMIFGGEHKGYQERCTTWEQAEKQHENACILAFMELPA